MIQKLTRGGSINIFATLAHTHSLGTQAVLSQVRNGQVIKHITKQDYYSPSSQHIIFQEPASIQSV